jgi:ubiquinone/menaquinone biosynthesis C-methylase UbiE
MIHYKTMKNLIRVLTLIIMLILVSCSYTKSNSDFNVHEYDKMFRAKFLPAFPVLAQEIIEYTKISKGTCVDIGCGPGYLALAVAKVSDLTVYALDISEPAIELAKEYIEKEGLANRITPVVGDVHNMPFDDNSMELVVSRGSLPFWRDKAKAFGEIKRILKPQGIAYIGCGFGSGYVKIAADKNNTRNRKPLKKFTHDSIIKALEDADIKDYTVIDDYNRGYWIIIRKG